MPGKFALRLLDHEKLMAVYNFTPSTSVTIVDMIKRKVVNQFTMPSCALIYPTGESGFSALCSNASMVSYELNGAGEVVGKHVIPPFFNIEKDALFEKPAIVHGIAYFPTFLGNVQEVNLRGKFASLGKRWSLVNKAERAENWRPGGIQLTGEDSVGRMYILMHEHGVEGSHKNPGAEVWVYDVAKRKRVERVKLKHPGLSVELTRDRHPLLLVVNTDMNVDVYKADSGKYVRTLSNFGQETPLVLYAAQ
jgi:methylamine dehydrogenase heavy chain